MKGKPVYVTWNEGEGTIVLGLDGADPKTFTTLRQPSGVKSGYAKDANHVYIAYQHAANQIEKADPNTFKVLDREGWYSKDRTHAYYQGAEIEGADAASFQSLPFGYAKDDKRAYIGTLEIPIKDVATFEPLNRGSGDDPWKRVGSGRRQPLKWTQRKTTELVASGWSRDASAIFYGAKLKPNIDPKTFSALGRFYAKDAKNVYFGDEVIAGADPQTFAVDAKAFNEGGISLNPGPDANDKSHTYGSGRILK